MIKEVLRAAGLGMWKGLCHEHGLGDRKHLICTFPVSTTQGMRMQVIVQAFNFPIDPISV